LPAPEADGVEAAADVEAATGFRGAVGGLGAGALVVATVCPAAANALNFGAVEAFEPIFSSLERKLDPGGVRLLDCAA